MRSPFIALVRKDLKGYFDQPTGYVLVVIFVALLSYAFFRSVDITGEASLRELFTVTFTVERPSLPWLLVLFVPAATMRLLAEEQRDGTLEILLTQPIRGWVVLIAKFLAGFLFVGVAIVATIGIPIALSTAGNLDEGAIIGQYVGSLLLAASFVSIGLFTSSLTQNQIVALIIGFTLTAVLMVVGLDPVIGTLPTRVSGLLQTLSPITHFSTIARGVIDLRDVLYFVALVSTFLSAAFLMMRSKILSHRTSQYRNLQLGVVGLIVLSLLVGWFGNSIGGRLDLTEDKLFTLSDGTEEVLDSLNDILTVTLYQTKDPPPRIKLATRDINDFLDDLAASSGGRVRLVKKYPLDEDEAGVDARRKAALAGVSRREFAEIGQTEASSKVGYLGMTVDYLNRRQVFGFIPTVDGFEYRLATSAYRMSQDDKTTVTFLVGHGERSFEQELQLFLSNLGQQYRVTQIAPTEDSVPDFSETDVLIVAGPTQPIQQATRDRLAAYLEAGGKALFLLEPVIVLPDPRGGLVALRNPNSFADFVEQYGIVLEDNVVFDLRKNETLPLSDGQGGTVYREYPFWPYAESADQTVARNIESVLMGWPSEVAFATGSRFETTELLASSPTAAKDFSFEDISPGAGVFQEVTEENQVRAVLGAAVSDAGGFRLAVVGDADWITDQMVQRSPDNLFLGLNLVDWLAEEELLADVRNKVVSTRRLEFSSSTHENTVQYVNIAGVPLGFMLVGLLLYARRRAMGVQEYRRER